MRAIDAIFTYLEFSNSKLIDIVYNLGFMIHYIPISKYLEGNTMTIHLQFPKTVLFLHTFSLLTLLIFGDLSDMTKTVDFIVLLILLPYQIQLSKSAILIFLK